MPHIPPIYESTTFLSTSGGMGKEMDMLVRQIATKLSVKRGERYSDTVGFVRRRIRFDLIRTCHSTQRPQEDDSS